MRSAYAAAVADRLVGSSPFVKRLVKLPKGNQPKLLPLTVEQVRQLADAMPARNRAMVVVTQAGPGLRTGELLGLRKEDVDFLRAR